MEVGVPGGVAFGGAPVGAHRFRSMGCTQGSLRRRMTASAKVSLWERGLQPSARVGRFTVKQPLGQSALVSSYLVEHSTLGFPALLKVATTAEAIASEANALALLHSPHVPLLYAQGELEDDNCIGSYFVCEFIEGTSLHHILREQRRLNVSLVLRL